MRYVNRHAAGFTLLELLMVIALVGILAAIVLPSAEPSINDQLRATARILATDLAYARSLAVTNNSTYCVVFDVKENRYILEHSGSYTSLDLLPESPFSRDSGEQKQMVVDLDQLPHLGAEVRLLAVEQSNSETAKVEFGPHGETTDPTDTIIWLDASSNRQARYIKLTVHPITGLVEVGRTTESGPPAWLAAQPFGSSGNYPGPPTIRQHH